MKHPIQPLEKDAEGILRFKENKIVRYLLDHGSIDLNKIADLACAGKFSVDDQRQFAQLIGYSLSGYAELSYVDDETFEAAELMRKGKDERDARIEYLQELVNDLKEALRKPMAKLFEVHPDDLRGHE